MVFFRHLLKLALLLFAKLQVEGVDTEGEVIEGEGGDHQDDGQGPGNSGGDSEVVTVQSNQEDVSNPDAKVEANPDEKEVDKDGLPLEDPNQPDEGGDERDQAEGDILTPIQLYPVLPTLPGILQDVEAEDEPVHPLGLVHHQLPKVCDIRSQADEVGGDANVDDAGQDGDHGKDEGPSLQGDAEELLGVAELEAHLLLSF